MTWSETHRRWQALAEIEALVNASESDELPWNADYAAIFGDPDGLAAALRYRWDLNRDAQLDSHLSEEVLEDQRRRLIARNAGVLRILERHARSVGGMTPVVPAQRPGDVDAPRSARVPA